MDQEIIYRRMWYNNLAIKFEIVKALRFRELQLIGGGLVVRWLNCQHIDLWDKINRYLKLDVRKSSLYRSLDKYRYIPIMSFNLTQRSLQYKAWSEQYEKHLYGPDFGLDIDNKESIEQNIIRKLLKKERLKNYETKELSNLIKNGYIHKDADTQNLTEADLTDKGMAEYQKIYDWKPTIPQIQAIKDLFDSYNVKYSLWMSGQHGFHLIVPFEEMPEDVQKLPKDQIYGFYQELAAELSKKAPMLDLSIYMPTRVFKAPYTITKEGRVVFPLNNDDWQQVKEDTFSFAPQDLIKRTDLRNRGIYLHGSEGGFKKLAAEWNGWEA